MSIALPHTPSPNQSVDNIVFIDTHELIVTLSSTESSQSKSIQILVFDSETTGEPKFLFNPHQDNVVGIVHLVDDIIATLDYSGIQITWRASSGIILSQAHLGRTGSTHLAKRDGYSLICLDSISGAFTVVSHVAGKKLKPVMRRNLGKFPKWIKIVVNAGICIAYYGTTTVADTLTVLNSKTFKHLGELSIVVPLKCVPLYDDVIIGGGGNRKFMRISEQPQESFS